MNDLSSATGSPRELRQLLDNNAPDLLPKRRDIRPRATGHVAARSGTTGHGGLGVAWTRSSVRVQVSTWPAPIPRHVRRHRVRRYRPRPRLPKNQPRESPEYFGPGAVVRHPGTPPPVL